MNATRTTLFALALAGSLPAASAVPAAAQALGAHELQQAPAPASPGWLGVTLSWDEAAGAVRIIQALPSSPARAAGVPSNARVVSLFGDPVPSVEAFIARISALPAGETVTLVLDVGGAHRTFDVTLGERVALSELARLLEGEPVPALTVHDVRSGLSGPLLRPGAEAHVVEFWATWCGPCRFVRPDMVAMHDAWGDRLDIVAVSGEGADEVSAYVGQHEMPYRVAVDPDGIVSGELLAMALPTWFVVDGDGRVIGVYSGSDEIDDVRARVDALLGESED